MRVTADELFSRASCGLPCWMGHSDGTREPLPTARWMGGPASSIEDRIADGLARRGISALGVDTSKKAVDLTVGRGGQAVLRDLFEPLPNAGDWACVLLADGNIGIGGDPVRLLRRAAELIRHDGG